MSRVLRPAVVALLAVAAVAPAAPVAVAAPTSRAVAIDIRPGSTDSALNLKGNPVLPVAVLTSAAFDATSLDVSSVCFGDPNNATQRDCREEHGTGHVEDVDADGDADLLLHFRAVDAGFDSGDARGCLSGVTTSGQRVHGCDALVVRNGVQEAQLPDLHVDLVAEPVSVGPADRVTWTATVTNEGVGALTLFPGDELLRFTVPTALSDVVVTPASGFACSAQLRCTAEDPETLLVGSTRVFALTATMPSAPGTQAVTAVADAALQFTETDESDNSLDAAAVVEPANLVVSLNVLQGAVSPGDTATWLAAVRNDGTVAAAIPAGTPVLAFAVPDGVTPTSVSGPAGFSCAATAAEYLCSSSSALLLPVGGRLDFTFAGTAAATADLLRMVATADPRALLSESDEADNTATADILVQLPNLVTQIVGPTGQISPGAAMAWTVTLINLGPGTLRIPAGTQVLSTTLTPALSGASVDGTDEYACAPLDASSFACRTVSAVTLFPGERDGFTVRGTAPASPGSVELVATADPAGLVREAAEDDNVSRSTADVTVPPVNLTVTATPEVDPVDALGASRWAATIRNTGDSIDLPTGTSLLRFTWTAGMVNLAVTTPSGYSCFIVDTNTADCATTVPVTIPAGGTVPVTVFATAPRQPGPISVSFTVDPLAVIVESDETDNLATATATVQPPDLSVTLTGSPDPVDALASSTWVVRVTNDGPANLRFTNAMRLIRFQVPSSLVNLAVSSPSNFTCFIESAGLVDCQATATMNLASGAVWEFTMFGTVPRQPGPLSMTVTADPLGVIPEGDETDNSATDTITVQPPDLSVTLTGSPDPVDALTSSTWVVRVTNDGPANLRFTNAMRLIRFQVPSSLVNLAVSSPSNFTCFIESAGLVDCQATATMNLASGAVWEFTMFGTVPRQPGPLSMTVTADPLGVIPEGDETDNSATDTITVQPPDLTATVTGSSALAPGESGSWTVRLGNSGPAVARLTSSLNSILTISLPGLSDVAVTPPAGFSCVATPFYPEIWECEPTSTQTIAVGGAVAFTVTGTAPTSGEALVAAVADSYEVIPEADEMNNQGSLDVVVG